MTPCQTCNAPTNLFLCRRCVDDLRANLTALATTRTTDGRRTSGLLEDLADVVLKRTRMGGTNGHRKRGDELPAPFEPDTTQGRQTAQGRADQLLTHAHDLLYAIQADVYAARGLPHPAAQKTAQMAVWLAAHTHTIATHETAGQRCTDIDALVHQIEHIIDRPEPPRFCGPCPHYVDHNRHCGRLLYAPRHRHKAGHQTPVVEVTCPACHTTHNIDTLTRRLELRADSLRFTSTEILTVMTALGTPIPQRTWRRWRTENRIKIRGYKRPDNPDGTRGSIGMTRHHTEDEPVYRLAEVRKVYNSAIRHSDVLTESCG